MRNRNSITLAMSLVALAATTADAAQTHRQRAVRIWDRVAGIPILNNDPRLAQMEALVAQGRDAEAAAIASSDDSFYNITLRRFFAVLSNRPEDPTEELNDFVATGIGIVRDDHDAREFLTGNKIYKAATTVVDPAADIHSDAAVYGSNSHYQYLDRMMINLRQNLVQADQKAFTAADGTGGTIVLTDTAGLITTRQWGAAHLTAGTNRRGIEFAFREFLCTPIPEWADATIADDRVRQDVDRAPGGDVRTFTTNCRGCHAVMDPLAGAYAFFDWSDSGRLLYRAGVVAGKNRINSGMFPAGYNTVDDSWQNRAKSNHNVAFGWSGAMDGNGIRGVGAMLANSKKFGACMAKRVFQEMCRRPPADAESKFLESLTSEFESNGRKLRPLFEKAAVYPNCLGNK